MGVPRQIDVKAGVDRLAKKKGTPRSAPTQANLTSSAEVLTKVILVAKEETLPKEAPCRSGQAYIEMKDRVCTPFPVGHSLDPAMKEISTNVTITVIRHKPKLREGDGASPWEVKMKKW